MITVTIVDVSTKQVTTKFGNKQTFSFKGNDGNWYSCGFKNPKVNIGETVAFNFQADKYGNQVDMNSMTAVAATAAQATLQPAAFASVPKNNGGSGKGVFPIPALDGQRAIVRQNALTNAREMVCSYANDGAYASGHHANGSTIWNFDLMTDDIIKYAKKFEAYACGDDDLKAAMQGAQQASVE